MGIKTSTYSDIENGRRELTERNKNLICQAFNVNPEWLETGEGDMFLETEENVINNLAKEYSLTDFEKKILTLYLELPEESRKKAMDFIKKLNEP